MSGSLTCADPPGPAPETPRVSHFIQLPAEIRLGIYRYVYWWKRNHVCGRAFTPTMHSPCTTGHSLGLCTMPTSCHSHRRTQDLTTLAILMRVCKRETLSLSLAPFGSTRRSQLPASCLLRDPLHPLQPHIRLLRPPCYQDQAVPIFQTSLAHGVSKPLPL
jgi:hypothetical protein